MPTINMRSTALKVKGQGVGSAYEEQVKLVGEGLVGKYDIVINSLKPCDITHYHTVNLDYYFHRELYKAVTPAICYVHFLPDTVDSSLDMPILFKKVFYKYLLTFYNCMDYLVAVNPTIVNRLAEYGVTKPKTVYIPNFVSEDNFSPQSKEKCLETRKKYGYTSKDFIVLGSGQLQTRKGISDFAEVAKRLPDIKFVWAGGFSFGKMSDGYNEIKKITETASNNLKFLGIVERSEMVDLYNMADVMFLPSFDELFPMTILEACCCKKPLILRDIDIYKDILWNGYIKDSDVEGFSKSIRRLSSDKSFFEYWMDRSWECHKFYSKEKILKKWEELYDEAYENSKRRRLLSRGRD